MPVRAFEYRRNGIDAFLRPDIINGSESKRITASTGGSKSALRLVAYAQV